MMAFNGGCGNRSAGTAHSRHGRCSRTLEVTDNLLIVDLTSARPMTARSISNVDVAERIAVVGDGIADAAPVDLHVV